VSAGASRAGAGGVSAGGVSGGSVASVSAGAEAGAGGRAGRGSDVLEVLERRGAMAYLGEPVAVVDHLLQCADLAAAAGEPPSLVAACLLHDIGWLLAETSREGRDRAEQPGHDHAERGAARLAELFPPAVCEPVRLHVEAKRWLVAVEPGALERLSAESRRTLVLQGGPFEPREAEAFRGRALSGDAVRLRRYDDAAKEPGRACPPLSAYVELLDELAAAPGRVGPRA